MLGKLFSTKVRVELLDKQLSHNNEWISKYTPWKDLWATIQLKDVKITKSLYLFAIRWKGEFPKNFRVVVNDNIFEPTQPVSYDFKNNLIIFHANIK